MPSEKFREQVVASEKWCRTIQVAYESVGGDERLLDHAGQELKRGLFDDMAKYIFIEIDKDIMRQCYVLTASYSLPFISDKRMQEVKLNEAKAQEEMRELARELHVFRNMSAWERVKYVFTGSDKESSDYY